jgi:hypothetical protein
MLQTYQTPQTLHRRPCAASVDRFLPPVIAVKGDEARVVIGNAHYPKGHYFLLSAARLAALYGAFVSIPNPKPVTLALAA